MISVTFLTSFWMLVVFFFSPYQIQTFLYLLLILFIFYSRFWACVCVRGLGDWDRWVTECFRSGLGMLTWGVFSFELHRFRWPWSGLTSSLTLAKDRGFPKGVPPLKFLSRSHFILTIFFVIPINSHHHDMNKNAKHNDIFHITSLHLFHLKASPPTCFLHTVCSTVQAQFCTMH